MLCLASVLALAVEWLPLEPAYAAAPATTEVALPAYRDIVRRYDSKDGLPQNSVNALQQDRSGYLWLGTYGGLVRFDGLHFEVFRARAGHGPGSDRILSLTEDRQGRLWIGTEDAGLAIRSPDGQFKRLPACKQTCRVLDLHAIGDRVVAVIDRGLLIFEKDSLEPRLLPRTSVTLNSATDRRGQLLLMDEQGFWRFDGRNVQPIAAPEGTRLLPHPLTSIDGEVHVMSDGQLHRWDGSGWQRRAVPGLDAQTLQVMRDGNGRFWASDDGAVVHPIDPAGHDSGLSATRLVGTVTRWLRDREGNLWFGTDGRGLYKVRASRIGLLQSGLFAAPGGAVSGDGAGGLWMAPSCEGVVHVDGNGAVTHLRDQNGEGAGCVWSLSLAPNGRLWVGSTEGRLSYLDPATGTLKLLRDWPTQRMIQSVHQTPEGEFWVSVGHQTYRGRVQTHSALPEALDAVPELEGMKLVRIQQARAGGVWLIGDGGALRWHEGRVVQRLGVAEGLSSRFVRSLHEEADGTIWLGTYGGGLNVVRNGQWTLYTEARGLQDDVISCIIEDQQGRVWLSGNQGISYVPREERAHVGLRPRIVTLGLRDSDGLEPEETNGSVDPACHIDPHGRLWFAMISGFAMIDPARIPTHAAAPAPPMIVRLTLSGRELAYNGRSLRIPANARDLDIRFSAPALSAPDKRQFRFRWARTQEWTELGERSSVFLPVVPPGHSEFEVAVRSAEGAWSAPTRLIIEHARPWYLQPGWLLLALVSIVLLTLLAQRLIAGYLGRHTEKVVKPLEYHAQALEASNRLLHTQARHDPLTGLFNRRHFDETLERLWQDPASRPLSLLLIDFDHFKAYNAHYGHVQGDACLGMLGTSIEEHIREGDLLARYGGEEFVLVLPGSDADRAAAMAERLREVVAGLCVPAAPEVGQPYVSVSIGVATETRPPEAGRLPAELVARADQAMQHAKRHSGARSTDSGDAAAPDA